MAQPDNTSGGAGQSAPSSPGAGPRDGDRLPFGVAVLVFIRERGIVVLWVLLLVFFTIWDWPYFGSVQNGLLILSAAALTAVFAAGVGVGALTGALDLSVPGTAGLAAVVCGLILSAGYPVWLGLSAGMAVGVVAGLVNGLITRSGLNPLVVTIGTLSVMSGLAAVLSGGYNISGLDMLKFMGTARYLGVPSHIYIVAVVYLLLTFFITKTRHGVRMVAVGGNPEAVRRVGINAGAYQLLGFVLCGSLSALAGLMVTAKVTEASPSPDVGVIFQALTAVALAGVSLAGGRGSLPKVLVGAIVLATIGDGLTVKGVPPYWATVTTGVLMIAALVVDKLLTTTISARLVAIGNMSVHGKGRAR
jgi:ribose transport system permease protein